jgi:hypothetical protein
VLDFQRAYGGKVLLEDLLRICCVSCRNQRPDGTHGRRVRSDRFGCERAGGGIPAAVEGIGIPDARCASAPRFVRAPCPFCLTHLGVWLPGRAASCSASVRSGRGSSERYCGSISVAFYTSSARAAGGGAPTGGLGSQRCIVPRHVNIPTATRCGYLDKPGATSERAMARGAPRSRPRGAQTAPWTGRLARTKERSHSWPVRLA